MDLKQYNINCNDIKRNTPVALLYKDALAYEKGAAISSAGALIAYSGDKTGRSPKDKRFVKHPDSQQNIDWGKVNIGYAKSSHDKVKSIAIDYLSNAPRLYVMDGFADWDSNNRIKIRVITTRPYHALFMHNMLIRPTKDELATFGQPDYVIFNAGEAKADTSIDGVGSETCVSISLEDNEMVILGTEYAGEMKKGVFTLMNYLMPKAGHLSMHCSATAETGSDKTMLLFGLSGTGKTTLSADPKRDLIGDDEHVWSEVGISNIEGGCYAKVIDLDAEREPDIYGALNFGAVLENVIFDDNHDVDYENTEITENTRGSYQIERIQNARIPCIGGHPTDIVFLTCDAFGVLPPVSKLDKVQAMYHFISGYTAKVAGTEVGVTEPEATFSACFGAPFMVWHPSKYAELLAEKMEKHNVNVWLVNTGWIGGGYGQGSRIPLRYSRAIINAINSGELAKANTVVDPIFGLHVVSECPEVPSDILIPNNAWQDKTAYEAQAKKLAQLFVNNFAQFADVVGNQFDSAQPKV